MRVAGKFSIVLVLAMLIGLTAYGFFRVDRERELFAGDMRRDGFLIATSIASALERVWIAEGRERAMGLVQHANVEAESIAVRWRTMEVLPSEVRERIARGEQATSTIAGPGGRQRLAVYVPVRRGEEIAGAVLVAHPFKERRAYIKETILNMLLTATGISALAGGLIMWLGVVLVGRPLDRLVAAARRAAGGDLTVRAEVRQRDEIGALADELNRMFVRLHEAHDKLAAESAARVATEDQLRQADRLTTVGTLSSAVAHELGTPLNVVMGRAQMIADGELAGDLAAKSARIIVEQVERMAKYLRQILDFARQRPRERQAHDLSRLVLYTLELLEPLAHKRGAAFDYTPHEPPVQIEMDSGAVQQVLANLIVNGIQSMADGGIVRVRLERRQVRDPVHVGEELPFAALVIQDGGAGISPEDRGRVFEPFFTTKPVGEGTGLGLSVAQEIVREHGGRIEVVSTPGVGSIFTVLLPDATP